MNKLYKIGLAVMAVAMTAMMSVMLYSVITTWLMYR